jgi:uncharacterized protein YggE
MPSRAHDERCERDTIRVVAKETDDVEASKADLFVTVEGASLVTGRAALAKAREVAQLVAALAEAGIAESAISVDRVEARTSSGLLTKSSSAVYTLKIQCDQLASLGDVLGAITSQKNTNLYQTVWRYDESPEAEAKRLAVAAKRARIKAQGLADALGLRITGVHRLFEGASAPVEARSELMGLVPQAARARTMTAEDLGLAVTHRKHIETTLTIDFCVESIAS